MVDMVGILWSGYTMCLKWCCCGLTLQYRRQRVCLLSRSEKGNFLVNFFLTAEPEVGARTGAGLGAGAIAGIVIAVILIVLITIDLFCCFFNSCGIIFCCHQAICGGGGGGGVKANKDDCKYAELR